MSEALPLIGDLADAYRARQVQWEETQRLRHAEAHRPSRAPSIRQEVYASEQVLRETQLREDRALRALVVWYEQQLGGVLPTDDEVTP